MQHDHPRAARRPRHLALLDAVPGQTPTVEAARAGEGAKPEPFAGVVERVTHHDPETGFAVLRVRTSGRKRPVAVVGRAPAVAPGEGLRAEGAWVIDPEHGRQFRAFAMELSPPGDAEALAAYLASGAVRGIGEVHGARLIEAFGAEALEIAATQPERLREVPGIGAERAAALARAAGEKTVEREFLTWLHWHGFTAAQARRALDAHGPGGLALVKANPYRLLGDVGGLTFGLVDRLAVSCGFGRTALERLRAGVEHALELAEARGDCGLRLDELRLFAAAKLGVPADLVERAVHDLADAGRVHVEATASGPACFSRPLHEAEEEAAAWFSRRAGLRLPLPGADEPGATGALLAEAGKDFDLSPDQNLAALNLLRARAALLAGGAGTGKTTLVRVLADAWRSAGLRVALAAPTGRAARRLTQATGVPAETLHRLLEADPSRATHRSGFGKGAASPLACDVLVIDEASMLDAPLLQATLRAMPEHAGLLLVGDPGQLPPVGPGQPFADLLASGVVPAARLEIPHRLGAGGAAGPIAAAAHRVRSGNWPRSQSSAEGGFHLVPLKPGRDPLGLLVKLVAERIPERFGLDPIADVQALCPVKNGPMGTREVNRALQAALNPFAADPEAPRLSGHGWTFLPGDKVMQVVNEPQRNRCNGDAGQVVTVDPLLRELRVRFEGDVKPAIYAQGEFDALQPAYAATVHKGQGSEFPAVVVPLLGSNGPALRRELLYTAITRATKLVVVLAEPEALQRALDVTGAGRRCTRLAGLLRRGAVPEA